MAIIYVRNDAAGAADGSQWVDAFLTLQAALTVWLPKDIIYVAADHIERYSASVILTCPNDTTEDHIPVYRVEHSTGLYSPPPQDSSTNDQFILTGISSRLSFNCNVDLYGLKLIMGDDIHFYPQSSVHMEDCEVTIGTDSSSSKIHIEAGELYAKNTYFRNIITVGSYIDSDDGRVVFSRCTFNMDFHTNGFVQLQWLYNSRITFDDCDFSLGAYPNLVYLGNLTNSGSHRPTVIFNNCKLRENYTLIGATIPEALFSVEANGCAGNGSSNWINEHHLHQGKVANTADVYRTSGYSETYELAKQLSIVMTPRVTCEAWLPIFTPKILGIVATTGVTTFTIQGLENYTTALTSNDCWIELSYYDTANAQRTLDTTTHDVQQAAAYTELLTGVGLTGWTGEPAGSRSFKLSVTVTVAKAGLYYAIVHLGKYEAGKTVHIDPMLVIT